MRLEGSIYLFPTSTNSNGDGVFLSIDLYVIECGEIESDTVIGVGETWSESAQHRLITNHVKLPTFIDVVSSTSDCELHRGIFDQDFNRLGHIFGRLWAQDTGWSEPCSDISVRVDRILEPRTIRIIDTGREFNLERYACLLYVSVATAGWDGEQRS